MFSLSLPAWGEWIEIHLVDSQPCSVHESLPAWGEWIEIRITSLAWVMSKSLPAWGEWIEIL